DAIDPSDPLFQPHRVPRQFQIDDNATLRMKVQSLARCVGGEQDAIASFDEIVEGGRPFLASESTVKYRDWQVELPLQMHQCVSILREDEQRLRNAGGKTRTRRHFGLGAGSKSCRLR